MAPPCPYRVVDRVTVCALFRKRLMSRFELAWFRESLFLAYAAMDTHSQAEHTRPGRLPPKHLRLLNTGRPLPERRTVGSIRLAGHLPFSAYEIRDFCKTQLNCDQCYSVDDRDAYAFQRARAAYWKWVFTAAHRRREQWLHPFERHDARRRRPRPYGGPFPLDLFEDFMREVDPFCNRPTTCPLFRAKNSYTFLELHEMVTALPPQLFAHVADWCEVLSTNRESQRTQTCACLCHRGWKRMPYESIYQRFCDLRRRIVVFARSAPRGRRKGSEPDNGPPHLWLPRSEVSRLRGERDEDLRPD